MRWTSMVVAAVAALSLGAAEFDLGNFIRSRYRAGEREIVLPDGEVRCRGMVELGREFRDLTIRGGRDTKLVCTNLSDLFFLMKDSRAGRMDHSFFSIAADHSRYSCIRDCPSLADDPSQIMAPLGLYHIIHIFACSKTGAQGYGLICHLPVGSQVLLG